MNFRGRTEKTKDEWLTPIPLIKSLGEFDLDPCASEGWKTANYLMTEHGLLPNWYGRVWLNPPFSEKGKWLKKMVEHGNGIALIPATGTETKEFFEYVWDKAFGILFMKGRVKFYNVDGTQGKCPAFSCCLIAYSEYDAEVLSKSDLGKYLKIK